MNIYETYKQMVQVKNVYQKHIKNFFPVNLETAKKLHKILRVEEYRQKEHAYC